MPLSPRPLRAVKLSASVQRAFGEDFLFKAFTTPDDVNARSIPDVTRPTPVDADLQPIPTWGVWRGPQKSQTPRGRGSASDDRAHNFTTSFPSVNVEDALLPFPVRMGDVVLRLLDGTSYVVGAPYADGHGRTTIPLTSKMR